LKRFPPNFGFRTGAVRSREVAYILAEDEDLVEKDQSHTVVLTWHKDKWLHHILSWVAKSACVLRVPKDQLLTIAGGGQFLVFGQGETTEGVITGLPTPDRRPGPFRAVREIGGQAYAVGLGGLAMKRSANGQWSSIGNGLPLDADLESMSGFSPGEMYAVGGRGQIWLYDSRSWRLVGSPTNAILTGVVCSPDGSVYCVGQRGVILKGRGDKWEEIGQTTSTGDLWGAEWFQEKLWISTMTSAYTLGNGELEPAKFGDDRPDTMYHLSAADGQLWSIGRKDIMAYDGASWRRIE
jgi:hypothetical protein